MVGSRLGGVPVGRFTGAIPNTLDPERRVLKSPTGVAEEPEQMAGDWAKPDVQHWLLAFLVSWWWSQASDSSLRLQQTGTPWLSDSFLDRTVPGDFSTSSSTPESLRKRQKSRQGFTGLLSKTLTHFFTYTNYVHPMVGCFHDALSHSKFA